MRQEVLVGKESNLDKISLIYSEMTSPGPVNHYLEPDYSDSDSDGGLSSKLSTAGGCIYEAIVNPRRDSWRQGGYYHLKYQDYRGAFSHKQYLLKRHPKQKVPHSRNLLSPLQNPIFEAEVKR